MKNIFETAVGGDGAQLAVGIDQQDLALSVKFPVVKIVDKVMPAVDAVIDKLEALIPGDQSELAAKLKAQARDEVLKLLTETPMQPDVLDMEAKA